jgi:hypothetical protein
MWRVPRPSCREEPRLQEQTRRDSPLSTGETM